MKGTPVLVDNCQECNFFWDEWITGSGKTSHCNFYRDKILWWDEENYTNGKKHSQCMVDSIVIFESD